MSGVGAAVVSTITSIVIVFHLDDGQDEAKLSPSDLHSEQARRACISHCNILLGLLLLVLIVKRFGSLRERHYENVYYYYMISYCYW